MQPVFASFPARDIHNATKPLLAEGFAKMARSDRRDMKFDGHKPNSLEQHPGVQRYFAEAAKDDPAHHSESDQAQGQGSSMVERDKPEPELKPDPEFAKDQDRETFNDKWVSEQDSGRQAMMERYENQCKKEDRSITHDHENTI